ncbi:MAG: hypothetical protein ACXVAX_11905 [Pseudobdellovibrio sp.]
MLKAFFFLTLIVINVKGEELSCGELQNQINSTQSYKPELNQSGLQAEAENLKKFQARISEVKSKIQKKIDLLRKPYLIKLLGQRYLLGVGKLAGDSKTTLQLTSEFEDLNNYLANPDCFSEKSGPLSAAMKYRCQFANKKALSRAPETSLLKIPAATDADFLMTSAEIKDLHTAQSDLSCYDSLLSFVKERIAEDSAQSSKTPSQPSQNPAPAAEPDSNSLK